MKNAEKREFHVIEWLAIVPGSILLFVYVTVIHFLYYTWVDYFKSMKYTILGLVSGVRGNTKELIEEIERRENNDK